MTLPPPPHALPTPSTQPMSPSDHHPSSAGRDPPVVTSGTKKKQFRFAHHAYRDRALIQHSLVMRIYDIEFGTAEIRFQQLTDAATS